MVQFYRKVYTVNVVKFNSKHMNKPEKSQFVEKR